MVGELDAAAHQLIERATALKSLLCFRILVLLASALTYCSWLTTYSVVSTANTDTTRIIEGNVTINAGAQSVGSLWLVAGVQFCVFLPLAYCLISRFSAKASSASSAQGEGNKELKIEVKVRKLAVDNILCCLAGVFAQSVHSAFVASHPSEGAEGSAGAEGVEWMLTAGFILLGAASACLLDWLAGPFVVAGCAPSNRERFDRIADVWCASFAWGAAQFFVHAIERTMRRLELSSSILAATSNATDVSAAPPVDSGVHILHQWALCAVALVVAVAVLTGIKYVCACCKSLRTSEVKVSEAALGEELTSALGGVGESVEELGGRIRDLAQKSCVWLAAITFDDAIHATFVAGSASSGTGATAMLAAYAGAVTLLAALLSVGVQHYIRMLLRRDEAVATACATNLEKLLTAALSYLVGNAWGRIATAALLPSAASGLAPLGAFAVCTTLLAILANVWLSEHFPKRQAKLIAAAQGADKRDPKVKQDGDAKEAQHI